MVSGPDTEIEYSGGGQENLGVITSRSAAIPTDQSGTFMIDSTANGGIIVTVPKPGCDGVVLRFIVVALATGGGARHDLAFSDTTLSNGASAGLTGVALANVLGGGVTLVGYSGLWYLRAEVGSHNYS